MALKYLHWLEIYNTVVLIQNKGTYKLSFYRDGRIKAIDNPSFIELAVAMRFRYFYDVCA